MKRYIFPAVLAMAFAVADAQTYKFSFAGKKDGYTEITQSDVYSNGKGYGYDFTAAPDKGEAKPYFFSADVPDGNYKVTVVLGSKKHKAVTTVRAESRRLFLENVATKKGEFKTFTFVVNKRNTEIAGGDRVHT